MQLIYLFVSRRGRDLDSLLRQGRRYFLGFMRWGNVGRGLLVGAGAGASGSELRGFWVKGTRTVCEGRVGPPGVFQVIHKHGNVVCSEHV